MTKLILFPKAIHKKPQRESGPLYSGAAHTANMEDASRNVRSMQATLQTQIFSFPHEAH